jgi:hypothetical protein
MATALAVGSGLFWTLTYVLIIRRGLADRTYGMPLVALCANLSWEFIFSVIRPHHGVQHIVDIVWLCLDLVIAYTAVRFGPREFPYLPRWAFYSGLAGTLVLSYLGVDLVCREFDGGAGAYAAFGQNLMMSGLFLAMLAARFTAGRGLAGQSAWIAAAKLIGTALASLAIWVGGDYAHSGLLAYLYFAILVVDLAYLAAVILVGRAGARTPASAPAVEAAVTQATAQSTDQSTNAVA